MKSQNQALSQDAISGSEDLLRLPPEQMRELGYAVVDQLIEHFNTVGQNSVISSSDPDAVIQRIREPFTGAGKDPHQILKFVHEHVLHQGMQLIHPRFFAYIPGATNFVSVLADLLASGFDVFAGTRPLNEGPAEIEATTIDWLCEQFGLPPGSGGLFASGGSAASLNALTAARHVCLDNVTDKAVVYYSTQTHSCIDRALFILGFQDDQIRKLEPGADLRLDPASLAAAVAADRAAGKRPFLVVGNAGATNAGTVDPLDALAGLCEAEGLWFHVDAAYGGGTILTERGRAQMRGVEQADSIAVDPHKWLFQPYECACVLVRDRNCLHRTFRRVPDYMRDSDTVPGEMNYRDMGLQITRSFKALKLWMSLQVFGVDAFRQAVDRGLDLAEAAEARLRSSGKWTIVTPATLGVVTFHYTAPDLSDAQIGEMSSRLTDAINRSGFAFSSSTILFGRTVLRLCPINPGCTQADIAETVERLEAIAPEIKEAVLTVQ